MANLDPRALEALAFLYLTFSHSTDGSLTGDEMRALADKLRGWSDVPVAEIGELLKRTVGEYKSLSAAEREARSEGCVDLVIELADETQRVQVLADLRAIAAADGHVSSEERAFMARLADRFGL